MGRIALTLTASEFEYLATLAECTGLAVDEAASRAVHLAACAEITTAFEQLFPRCSAKGSVRRPWFGHCTSVSVDVEPQEMELLCQGKTAWSNVKNIIVRAICSATDRATARDASAA